MKDLIKDRGSFNLVILVVSVWSALFSFYGFLAYRARLWSPLWVISPTEKVFALRDKKSAASHENSPLESGRLIFRELRCGVCHGPSGEGGVKNPNADPDGFIPNLFDLPDAFTWNDLKDKIRNGALSAKLEEGQTEPPLSMPSWKDVVTEEEMETLVLYLFSLKSPPDSGEKEDEIKEE